MFKEYQNGFTLVELILVMAISSSMGVIALMGFSALRGQAQFSDSIEHVVQNVLAQRQESLGTVTLSGGGSTCTQPSSQCDVVFGKLLTFNPGSSQVKVDTLITTGDPAPNSTQNVVISPDPADKTVLTLPWGVTFVSSQVDGGGSAIAQPTQVAFVRSSIDGTLQTAISTNSPGGWTGLASGNYSYGNFDPGGSAVDLNLTDPSGRQAYLVIDPANNGVTRIYR